MADSTTGTVENLALVMANLSHSIEELKATIASLNSTIDSLKAENEYLKNNNELLREENAYLKRKLFGTKSEKITHSMDQLSLFDEAENECSSSRGNGYGTLPQPGWQWKNCPSPVAPLEPKVFESMDQKRSLERSEGSHPQQSEETCFPPAIASKELPKGAERSRQLGRVTRHRPPGPLRVQRLAADHCRKREPVPIWRPGMYWPSQPPSAHRGPWSTRHNRNPPATVPLFSEETCSIPHKKNLLLGFPVPPTFAFERKGSRDSIAQRTGPHPKKEGPWFCPSLHDRSA